MKYLKNVNSYTLIILLIYDILIIYISAFLSIYFGLYVSTISISTSVIEGLRSIKGGWNTSFLFFISLKP